MKGMVFTEFYSLVESLFGEEMLDDIIDEANLANNGAFTAVGTYDHQDLVKMVVILSQKTNTPVPDLVKAFGGYLFERFTKLYPQFFQGIDDSFVFLSTIEDIIHVEVKKLYPEAELPKFEIYEEDKTLVMIYSSSRHFSDLALGLIEGAGKYFGDAFKITKRDLSEDNVEFRVDR